MSENDELRGWPAAIGVVVMALLFGGVILAIYPGWNALNNYLNSTIAAAWVQAFGAIGAIVGAFVISSIQWSKSVEHNKKEKKDYALVKAIHLNSIVGRQINIFKRIDENCDAAFEAGSVEKVNFKFIDWCFGRLDKYDRSDAIDLLPLSPSLAKYLMTASDCVDNLLFIYSSRTDDVLIPAATIKLLSRQLKETIKILNIAKSMMDEELGINQYMSSHDIFKK